jgi:hypothetical protein
MVEGKIWALATVGVMYENAYGEREPGPVVLPSGPPWVALPGPVEDPPRAPVGLGGAGQRWWRAAWRGPSSAGWSEIEVELVRRGAALADKLAAGPVRASTAGELRAIEDTLGLTRAGRVRLHLLAPGEVPRDRRGRPLVGPAAVTVEPG